jgi:hypothetical protein
MHLQIIVRAIRPAWRLFIYNNVVFPGRETFRVFLKNEIKILQAAPESPQCGLLADRVEYGYKP